MALISTFANATARGYGLFVNKPAIVIPDVIDVLAFNSTPSGTTAGPINNYYRRYVYKAIYTAAELVAAGWSSGQTIRRLSLYVTSQPTYQPYPLYAIGMINTGLSVGSDFTSGITTVVNQASRSFTVNQENIITLDTAFAWDGTSNLGISFAWGQCPTTYSSTGVVRSNTGGSGRYSRTDSSGTYLISDVAGTTVSGRPCVKLYRTL